MTIREQIEEQLAQEDYDQTWPVSWEAVTEDTRNHYRKRFKHLLAQSPISDLIDLLEKAKGDLKRIGVLAKDQSCPEHKGHSQIGARMHAVAFRDMLAAGFRRIEEGK